MADENIESEKHTITPPAHDIYAQQRKEWLKKGSPLSESVPDNDDSCGERSNNWLIFMVVSIVAALLLFMIIPWIENFIPQEQISTFLENIKVFLSFGAPVLIIVAAIAGTAGYYRIRYVAWSTLLGHIFGYILFVATIQNAPQTMNFGVYWIVLGSFAGGFLGSLLQFIRYIRRKQHRELLPLLFIGFTASLVAGVFLVRFTTKQNIEYLTYIQVAEEIGYELFEPSYLPEKLRDMSPKIYVEDGVVSTYYGDDHYPPPPVIDFLTGIELVQSVKIDDMDEAMLDPEPGVVFVEIEDGSMARFSERRGRATIEWNREETHLVLNIYSNIPAREMFTIARSLVKVDVIE